MLFAPAATFIIIMPAMRRESQGPPVAEPYTLVGAPKPQLAALTVTALKSHLKHYGLATKRTKATLVDASSIICAHFSQQMLTPQQILMAHSQATQLPKQPLPIVVWALNQQLLLFKQHIPCTVSKFLHPTCEFWHSRPTTTTC